MFYASVVNITKDIWMESLWDFYMNSNLKLMLESVILDSVNSIIDEFWLEKEGKWSVYLLHKGVGEGGGT